MSQVAVMVPLEIRYLQASLTALDGKPTAQTLETLLLSNKLLTILAAAISLDDGLPLTSSLEVCINQFAHDID